METMFRFFASDFVEVVGFFSKSEHLRILLY